MKIIGKASALTKQTYLAPSQEDGSKVDCPSPLPFAPRSAQDYALGSTLNADTCVDSI